MPDSQQGNVIADSAQIVDGIIVAADIATDAITAIKVADNTIGTAEVTDGTIANADIAANAAIDDAKLATIDDSNKVSGASFSSLASIPAGVGVIPSANVPAGTTTHSVGVATRALDAADGAVTYAHGLTGTPKLVELHSHGVNAAENAHSVGFFDGTNNRCHYSIARAAATAEGTSTVFAIRLYNPNDLAVFSDGVITVDATNIIITWTKTGTIALTENFIWHATL